ncbi:MAG: helicase-related protein, partial [Verrucomicrobiales bacterium]|nr:helicase-related protein [Verrucomicrobiales bacterium]
MRQVARTLLSQTFRLTDTVLDLFFADESVQGDPSKLPRAFLTWLAGADPGARRLLTECRRWLSQLRLVVDACLEGAGKEWWELARIETWKQLFNPSAVVGVTGSSGVQKSAIRQFRTPSLPRVIVCTDTLKEGVDLHLFCDRVLHYGVAWTSGDLEQRVGRVDRFFSQIERRLSEAEDSTGVQLTVGYPHIASSLEQDQVRLVRERQKRVELLMDSPLAGAHEETKDLVIGSSIPQTQAHKLEAYKLPTFPELGKALVSVSMETAGEIREHYETWYGSFVETLKLEGWGLAPEDSKPVRVVTLHKGQATHDLEWGFDAALDRYVITLSDPPQWKSQERFLGRRRRLVAKRRRTQTFLRFLVPARGEANQESAIQNLINVLNGQALGPNSKAKATFEQSLSSMAKGELTWLEPNSVELVVPLGDRAHAVTLEVCDGET